MYREETHRVSHSPSDEVFLPSINSEYQSVVGHLCPTEYMQVYRDLAKS